MQQKGHASQVSPCQMTLFLVAFARSSALSALGEGPSLVMPSASGALVAIVLQAESREGSVCAQFCWMMVCVLAQTVLPVLAVSEYFET